MKKKRFILISLMMASGGKLTIKNGGKIVMRTNSEFYAPAGAFVDVSCGQIIRSNDF